LLLYGILIMEYKKYGIKIKSNDLYV